MLFNSFTFAMFFPTVVILYYLFPHRFRWLLLLTASCIFYMAWNPPYIILIFLSVAISHVTTMRMVGASEKQRRVLLAIDLFFHFATLFFFKYFNFFYNTFSPGSADFNILLPMGISFHTFQAVGYAVDVYRREMKPEKSFLKLLLFIMFFPQLVAGPIERASALLPQLFTKKIFKYDNLVTGLKYISFGLFKKIAIADRTAVIVNTVYNSPADYQGLPLVIATFLFAFQVYCDFSGYSDIAVGCAKVLDIDLMRNFRQPYLSKSIKEFWRRWHISLSFWFKDYLYIPLGGSRVSKPRYYLNIMITFLISGLWHGANWTFVIWGALHGLYQIIEDRIHIHALDRSPVLGKYFRIFFTFALVCFAYIFFRANSLSDSLYVVTHLFTNISGWIDASYIYQSFTGLGVSLLEVLICFGLILFLILSDAIAGEEDIHIKLSKAHALPRFAYYLFIMAIIMGLGVYYNASEFIYFQF